MSHHIHNKYLTQSLLKEFVNNRFSNNTIIENKGIPENKRLRPDFLIKEFNLLIEFDGFAHYTNPKVIVGDKIRDKFFFDNGYTLVRIPYFVQLDSNVIELLFSNFITDLSPFNSFPHGFIDEKALTPAYFCYLGVLRFKDDLQKFSIVKEAILDSLKTHPNNQLNSNLVYSGFS